MALPDLQRVLILLGTLLAAFLVSRLLQRRGVEVTGLEALAVGALLGPAALWDDAWGSPFDALLRDLSPLMSFAIGAVGFGAGLALRLETMATRPRESIRITNVMAIVTLVLVGGAVFGVLVLILPDLGWEHAQVAAILASASLLGAPGSVRWVRGHHGAQGPMTELLAHVTSYSQIYGIVVFGLVTALLNPGAVDVAGHRVSPFEWVGIGVGSGVVIGLLFSWFLGSESQNDDALTVTLVGVVLFAAGIAQALNLSPLLVCLAVGVTVVNTSPAHATLPALCARIEGPFLVALVFFAACAWRFPAPLTWVLVPAYVVARIIARWIGAGAAALVCPSRAERPVARMGPSLLGSGSYAVAIALSTWQVHGPAGEVSATVLTCLLIGSLVSELPSRRLVRNLLVDVGEVTLAAPRVAKPEAKAP